MLVAGVAALLCACAASPPSPPGRSNDGDSAGARVLERVCAGCHTSADIGRPDLSQPRLDQAVAAKALRAVLAHEMPPPAKATSLESPGRASLIRYLCRSAGRPDRYCELAARPSAASPPIRTAATFLVSLKRIAPTELPDDVKRLTFMYSMPSATRIVRTPASVAVAIAAAAAVCATAADLRSCVRKVLDLGTAHAKPPAGAERGD